MINENEFLTVVLVKCCQSNVCDQNKLAFDELVNKLRSKTYITVDGVSLEVSYVKLEKGSKYIRSEP